jgi:hypothetical protein
LLGNFIYVVGGYRDDGRAEKSCEAFHLKENVWKHLPDYSFGHGLTLLSIKHRYVVALGGCNSNQE